MIKYEDVVRLVDNPFGSINEMGFYEEVWWALETGRCAWCGKDLAVCEIEDNVLSIECHECESGLNCSVPDQLVAKRRNGHNVPAVEAARNANNKGSE